MIETIEIVVIDDEPQTLEELRLLLETVGKYKVITFSNAFDALNYLKNNTTNPPGLIIADIMMPEIDGYIFGNELRKDYHLQHIPLLYLTARTAINDRIDARKITPHYFAKDGDPRELLSVISSILEENSVQVGVNPLTRLPGNVLIEKTINKIIRTEKYYSIYYIDFDNFKAYNDAYGTHAGDKAIQEGAIAIDRSLRFATSGKYFLGHVGGDDFIVIVWDETKPEKICESIFSEIIKIRHILYSEFDISRGFFEAKNRKGIIERYNLLSVSIGILTSDIEGINSWADISDRLISVKRKAKEIQGNSYWIDKRR